jgi:hypothetical protein
MSHRKPKKQRNDSYHASKVAELNSEIEELRNRVSRSDSIYYNLLTGQGTQSDVNEMTKIKPFTQYSFPQVENLYTCDPTINRIIRLLVKYMFKDSFEIKSEDLEYNAKFKRLFTKKYRLWKKLKDLATSGYIHGHSFLIIRANGSTDYSEPLSASEVHQLDDVNLINRYFLAAYPEELDFEFNPISYYVVQQPLTANKFDLNDSTSRKEYMKEVSALPQMGSQKIHKSRLLGFYGVKLMPFTFRSNLHFHDTYIRNIENAARNYSAVMDNLATLLAKVPMPVHKIQGLSAALTNPEQRSKLAAALAAKNKGRSLHNISAIDSTEEFEYYTPTLTGISELIRETKERLCLDTDIPHDVLFNEGSTGQTTGRTEKTTFQGFIDSERGDKLTPIIEYFMRVFENTDGLKMPEDYEVSYEHHEAPTQTEESAVFASYASGIVSLEGQGYDCSDFLVKMYPDIQRADSVDLVDLVDKGEPDGDEKEDKEANDKGKPSNKVSKGK